jgi:hypothetical protein
MDFFLNKKTDKLCFAMGTDILDFNTCTCTSRYGKFDLWPLSWPYTGCH